MAVLASFTAHVSLCSGSCERRVLELISPNKTASTSKEEENMLWDKKILGTSNPLILQRAVFFSVGKVFCLRGGEDQCELKPSQLIRKSNPDRYVYVETGSKNQTGGLKQLVAENKVAHVYASPPTSSFKHCCNHTIQLVFFNWLTIIS